MSIEIVLQVSAKHSPYWSRETKSSQPLVIKSLCSVAEKFTRNGKRWTTSFVKRRRRHL